MDPNFIRPVMTSYLANHARDTRSVEDRTLAPGVSPSPRQSLATRARLASGALLIAAGKRLAGTPQMAYGEPSDQATGVTP